MLRLQTCVFTQWVVLVWLCLCGSKTFFWNSSKCFYNFAKFGTLFGGCGSRSQLLGLLFERQHLMYLLIWAMRFTFNSRSLNCCMHFKRETGHVLPSQHRAVRPLIVGSLQKEHLGKLKALC